MIDPTPPADDWYAPFLKAVRVGSFLLAHGLTTALLILLLAGFSRLLEYLGHPMLFERVPASYIFDAMELMVLAVYALFGTLEAVSVFRGKGDERTGATRSSAAPDGSGAGPTSPPGSGTRAHPPTDG